MAEKTLSIRCIVTVRIFTSCHVESSVTKLFVFLTQMRKIVGYISGQVQIKIGICCSAKNATRIKD